MSSLEPSKAKSARPITPGEVANVFASHLRNLKYIAAFAKEMRLREPGEVKLAAHAQPSYTATLSVETMMKGDNPFLLMRRDKCTDAQEEMG